MNTKNAVNALWEQLRSAINTAYRLADESRNQDGICLRDYAENISWSDDLAKLLASETANEKQHRSNRPSVPGFSAETAAKLITLDNIADGSRLLEMPKATMFLVMRKTAAESIVIGWLLRNTMTPEWRDAVKSLDYATLMKGGN